MNHEIRRVPAGSGLALLTLLTLGSCTRPEPTWEYHVLVPTEVEVVADESAVPLGAWQPSHLQYGLGHYFISDRLTRSVLVLDHDGGFVRRLGRGGGQGPGEFEHPDRVTVLPDSTLWVSDRSRLRISRFSLDGEVLDTRQLQSRAYGLLGDGQVLMAGAHLEGGLAVTDGSHWGEAPAQLEWESGLPPMVSLTGGAKAAGDGADRVFILDNLGGEGWLVDATGESWRVDPVVLPDAVMNMGRGLQERRLEMVASAVPPGQGLVVPLFDHIQSHKPGRWWIMASWNELLGMEVDPGARRLLVVLDSEVLDGRRRVLGSVLASDSELLLLYDHELLRVTLGPGPPPDWLEP